jgi:hypothetical protein
MGHEMPDRTAEKVTSGGQVTGPSASSTSALIPATISFTLSFAAWGLVGGLASVFTGLYRLTSSQVHPAVRDRAGVARGQSAHVLRLLGRPLLDVS